MAYYDYYDRRRAGLNGYYADRGLNELHQEGLIFKKNVSIPRTKREWLVSLEEAAEELKERGLEICELYGEDFAYLTDAIVYLLDSERHGYQKILLIGAFWINKKGYSAYRIYSRRDYIRDSIRDCVSKNFFTNDNLSDYYKFLDRGLPDASDFDPHP